MVSDPARAGRAALLDLLADLLLHELPGPLAERLAADPMLAEALQPATTSVALSALRVEYADLFLLDLPPYSSVFLDVPPVIGGESARRWERTLSAVGLELPGFQRAAAPDHAGLVLRALARAERAGRVADLLPLALAWLPQCLTAVRQYGEDCFYGRVAALALLALGATARAADGPLLSLPTNPPPQPEDNDLRTLSRWLCTPAWSGWFLSKRHLRQLARRLGSGPGIVDRAPLLQQVFEASGLDGRTAGLLTALRAELSCWQVALQEWREALGAWSVVLESWAAQLAATATLLTQMHTATQTAVAE